MTINCHAENALPGPGAAGVALIGHPNVGKSTIFQRLTGQRVVVSNYPGTTVAITRGKLLALPDVDLVDTPGLITIPTQTEDEHVTARVLLEETPGVLLQVGDAKNVRRALLLTIQLAEMGLPLVLALNMSDEARHAGLHADPGLLGARLGIPVVCTAATRGEGIAELLEAVRSAQPARISVDYPPAVEQAVSRLEAAMPPAAISGRALALLWLGGEPASENWLRQRCAVSELETLTAIREDLESLLGQPVSVVIQNVRMQRAGELSASAESRTAAMGGRLGSVLGRLAMHPVYGWGLLALVLYGMYWFVGIFGAGTLVGLLEEQLFGGVINPWLTEVLSRLIPAQIVVDFLVGEYGLWTIGMTYALALILPIVTTFFLAFGVLEDSGYLPRLVALSNRAFQSMGLNGKAVLPMVLGLGCVTMATLTTRVLETRRERLLATLLLALAVPCSAQLGVVMGLLAGTSLVATLIWGGVILAVLLLVGWLAARLVPGDRSPLLIELPPLRVPGLANVSIKTLARLEWYLKEVIPLFLIGAAVMFLLDQLGLLDGFGRALRPLVVHWLGLPQEATSAFLMGFLRRDFGATGLFLMEARGLLTPVQVVVSMVTITLFIPCVASVLVIAREHGRRAATGMVILVFPLAFLVAGLLFRLLVWIGWSG